MLSPDRFLSAIAADESSLAEKSVLTGKEYFLLSDAIISV